MSWLKKLKYKYNLQRLIIALLMLLLSSFSIYALGTNINVAPVAADCAMVSQHSNNGLQDAPCFAQEHLHCHQHSLVVPTSLSFAALQLLPANSATPQVSFHAIVLADDPPPPRS